YSSGLKRAFRTTTHYTTQGYTYQAQMGTGTAGKPLYFAYPDVATYREYESTRFNAGAMDDPSQTDPPIVRTVTTSSDVTLVGDVRRVVVDRGSDAVSTTTRAFDNSDVPSAPWLVGLLRTENVVSTTNGTTCTPTSTISLPPTTTFPTDRCAARQTSF